jgi:hypothetical protein
MAAIGATSPSTDGSIKERNSAISGVAARLAAENVVSLPYPCPTCPAIFWRSAGKTARSCSLDAGQGASNGAERRADLGAEGCDGHDADYGDLAYKHAVFHPKPRPRRHGGSD